MGMPALRRAGNPANPAVMLVHGYPEASHMWRSCLDALAARDLYAVAPDTGFFPDGRWHDMAAALRTPGQGEELVDGMTRESFGQLLRAVSTGIDDEALDEYFKAFADEPRRRGQLELYRSGDFSKLAPYQGQLAGLGVPFLALWGESDPV